MARLRQNGMLPGPGDPESWPAWARNDPRSPLYEDPAEGMMPDDIIFEAQEEYDTFCDLYEMAFGEKPSRETWKQWGDGNLPEIEPDIAFCAEVESDRRLLSDDY